MMAKVQSENTSASTRDNINDDSDVLDILQRSPSEMPDVSASNSDDNHQPNEESEDETPAPQKRVKRRIQQFSDSDSGNEETQEETTKSDSKTKPQSSDSDSDMPIFKSVPQKSRILNKSLDSDESETGLDKNNENSDSSISNQAVKNGEQQTRMKNKQSKLKDKFQNLLTSRGKGPTVAAYETYHDKKNENFDSSISDQALKNAEQQTRMKNKQIKLKDRFQKHTSRGKGSTAAAVSESNKNTSDSSEESNDESSSIEKIKQKIKERMSFKPSICDPDTSDEESSQQKSVPNQKKRKTIKLTSPKPQRMSAKQAMENMQKIKSESNRMLREKEVSLPYHRPKALSLKDIMSRRNPAVSADGKSLPIKMNGEQLRQYAQQLEERQKQMMVLWQSDTDEDENDKKSDDEKNPAANTFQDHSTKNDEGATNEEAIQTDGPMETDMDADETAEDNDKLFDNLSQSIIDESKINETSKVVESTESIESKEDKICEAQEVESNTEGNFEELDSETSMKLVFNESETNITEEKSDDEIIGDRIDKSIQNKESSIAPGNELQDNIGKPNTEDSQLISLHYDTEKQDSIAIEIQADIAKDQTDAETETNNENINKNGENEEPMDVHNDFSDDEIMNMEDIDTIIENAEIIRDIEDKINSQVLIRDINVNPKLTGAPGMVIDLDDMDTAPKKSGVELLKERFTYFAKLKTPEELERDREKKIKPGTQHSKLKQVLEEQMAEQRSLEWAKRLEDEKQHQKELKELRGEESDDENDIDKLEAKLEGDGVTNKSESESEEELEENDIEMKDKPRVKNPMLENEAEESDGDENVSDELDRNDGEINDEENVDDEGDESSDDSDSSDSEEETTITKKGRILKAFEDSDDEEAKAEQGKKDIVETNSISSAGSSQPVSQDEILTLAQRHKSVSEDLFTSQESSLLATQKAKSPERSLGNNDADLGTQTFSILDSSKNMTTELELHSDKLGAICETQPFDDNLDAVAALCSGSFSQSLPIPLSNQISQSLPIGDDVLALCTGKFYNNEFVSQVADNGQLPLGASQEFDSLDEESQTDKSNEVRNETNDDNDMGPTQVTLKQVNVNEDDVNTVREINKVGQKVDDNLKSILDELDDPEFDTPKPNKFFCGAKSAKSQVEDIQNEKESQIKKRLIIDSDEETNDSEIKKRKKIKKKKPKKRALQISDDEEDSEEEEIEEYESEIEEAMTERLVEYDSEENEIEVKPQKPSKKKRKGNEFFEQEAELTSEDEWVGSGDEDEAGLDRMEREEGDDDTFHQGQLQKELGQIHMRDVLDQDKREVRIIQELLFEDGDLGAGGRQRKFKWKNLDGEDETGAAVDEFGDTQQQEFESEEQWRKQRHERETYLRQMQNNDDLDDSLNVTVNRTAIIKANLSSGSVSMLLEESAAVDTDPIVTEKKTTVISPKKPFSILQQSYQGSILNRGKGALARLAALATPLAVDDDAPKVGSLAPSSRRNFVFSTLTPEAPKVTKRKAESNPSTPKLVKKMRTEEKQNISKNSLLDHMKV